MMRKQLCEQVRRTKGKLNVICVTFNLDTMDRYKNRKRVSQNCMRITISDTFVSQ